MSLPPNQKDKDRVKVVVWQNGHVLKCCLQTEPLLK